MKAYEARYIAAVARRARSGSSGPTRAEVGRNIGLAGVTAASRRLHGRSRPQDRPQAARDPQDRPAPDQAQRPRRPPPEAPCSVGPPSCTVSTPAPVGRRYANSPAGVAGSAPDADAGLHPHAEDVMTLVPVTGSLAAIAKLEATQPRGRPRSCWSHGLYESLCDQVDAARPWLEPAAARARSAKIRRHRPRGAGPLRGVQGAGDRAAGRRPRTPPAWTCVDAYVSKEPASARSRPAGRRCTRATSDGRFIRVDVHRPRAPTWPRTPAAQQPPAGPRPRSSELQAPGLIKPNTPIHLHTPEDRRTRQDPPAGSDERGHRDHPQGASTRRSWRSWSRPTRCYRDQRATARTCPRSSPAPAGRARHRSG